MVVGPILTLLYFGNGECHTKSVNILHKENSVKSIKGKISSKLVEKYMLHMQEQKTPFFNTFEPLVHFEDFHLEKKDHFFREPTNEHSYQI